MSELVTEGRRLVKIRKIDGIESIHGADFIVEAHIDGWSTVTKKDEFQIGDYCLFFEIDSFLPASDPRYSFLLKNGTKLDDDKIERIRLKTVKLKKVLSQGLALPLKDFPELNVLNIEELYSTEYGVEQYLNVTKYERPEEKNGGAGNAKTAGDFPFFVPKTDLERIQSFYHKYQELYKDVEFRPSLKMDGSSTTIAFVHNESYFNTKIDNIIKEYNEETEKLEEKEIIPYPFKDHNGMILVCSRNLTLKYDNSTGFWKSIINTQVHEKLKQYCIQYDRQLAIQGEMCGPGVNGNWDKLSDYDLFVFHIWDIDKQEYLEDKEFQEICYDLKIQTVKQFPVIKAFSVYSTLNDFLKASEIPSINNPIAEGIAYKSTKKVDGKLIMFKVINNKYLLSEK